LIQFTQVRFKQKLTTFVELDEPSLLNSTYIKLCKWFFMRMFGQM